MEKLLFVQQRIYQPSVLTTAAERILIEMMKYRPFIQLCKNTARYYWQLSLHCVKVIVNCSLRKYSTDVELTRHRYPNVKRGNYSKLEENDVKVFQSIVGNARVLTQTDELDGIGLLFLILII